MDLTNFNNAVNNVYEQNPHIKLWITLVTGILLGYTLGPVPVWLQKMLDNNIFLKFYIIFIFGIVASVPLKGNILIFNFVFTILLLFLMEQARRMDKKRRFK